MWILKMLWTFIKALFRRPPELTNEAKQRMLDNIKKKAGIDDSNNSSKD